VLWIDGDVKVKYSLNLEVCLEREIVQRGRADVCLKEESASQQIINTAVGRTFRTIFEQNFVPWKFNPRNSDYEPDTTTRQYIKSITLQKNSADPTNITKPVSPIDESYTLSVPTSGEVLITANSSIGLSYGLTTFSQLFFQHSNGGAYTKLVPVTVSDVPKFPHRGLNMDTARNYFPLVDIFRTMDAMAFTKMNRLVGQALTRVERIMLIPVSTGTSQMLKAGLW